MSWVEDVAGNMAVLKGAGYGFVESWEVTLETFPMRMTFGAPPQTSLFDAGDEPSLVEFTKARLWESWHGTRPELVAVARGVSELFGWDGGTRAVGRNLPAA